MNTSVVWSPRVLVSLAVLASSLLASLPAHGQYFGRNKVQYRTFDFQILRTEHFDVYFYPEEEAAARDAARMAERWYARLSRILDHRFEERQPLILYANHPHFQQTNTYSGSIGEGTGGFTEVFKQRVVMPFTHSYAETDHVLGHELVHAFQYDISGLGRAGGGLEAAARRYQVPLWFTEGMAEYLSLGPVDAHTAMWLRDAALQGEIPSIERMTSDPRVFPYRWGHALWAYVGGRWGDATIGQILRLAGQGVPYPEAFQRILNISVGILSDEWHAAIRRAYLPMLPSHSEAREIARPLLTPAREGGRLNVAPSLSPDGRFVAFISERDFLDAELWLADAQTGQVLRRLQRGAAFDPHFGSLRYINSAGTWSPEGSRFAFSALRGGSDVLVVVNVADGRRLREFSAEGVGEITNPTWSPDGRSIAFTGLHGGLSDLFLLDVETGSVRPLTDDPYTELHPSFSPDGRTIAFTTDRGAATDLDRLSYGPYRLALFHLETSEIELLPHVEEIEGYAGTRGKSINPVWTPDGTALHYVSTRSGIPNIYRLDLRTREVRRVTNLFTGVSGITGTSPAVTAARAADRLLFTVYENGGYNIYALTDPRDLAGTPLTAPDSLGAGPYAALLPPIPRPRESAYHRVANYLGDPLGGLPGRGQVAEYDVIPYRPRLGLDYLGQPQVGVAVGSPYGGNGLHGAVAGIFSDVLGRHSLFAAVQAQGQIDEIGFATQYLNARERWNWGGIAQRLPYVVNWAQYGSTTSGSMGTVSTYDLIRARFFDTRLQGYAQYPLSTVKRVEATAGVHRISRDYQYYRLLIDPVTGRAFDVERETVAGYAVNMLEASAALVYDDALFGYTSPFSGQRYRFQVRPIVGDIDMVHALADYRRYIFVRPFTLAFQGLHNAKYGPNSDGVIGEHAEQRVFYDDYLGYAWNVRGYYNTYDRCRSSNADAPSCALLDQLLGSRIGVAKAELRFPLIQYLVLGPSIGLPPIEGFGFFDAGVAWSDGTRPSLQRGIPADLALRGLMTSAGVGARVNLFGYLVLEIDYVRAFALPDGWRWQFSAIPGF
jgi:Tol biopolymer transport system component